MDWPRAIELARELKSEDFSFQHELAQYHCELAQGALIKSDFDGARRHVADALAKGARVLVGGKRHAAGKLLVTWLQWPMAQSIVNKSQPAWRKLKA